jgi:S-(hydroxymethyl)glutathione dehydrogenase/alcohol dehydrogenase
VPKLGARAGFQISDLYHNKSILGCRYGDGRPQFDIPRFARLYIEGRLQLDAMVSRVYALDDYQVAFAELESGGAGRGVFALA